MNELKRRMEVIFLLTVCLLAASWETAAVSVPGKSGEKIEIKCSHSNAFSNVKYFCRGQCRNEDVLISSRKNKIDTNGRYSIHDTGNVFFVTISNLREDDSGTYWCAIDRIGWDTYNEVVLTVIEGKGDKHNGKYKDKKPADDSQSSSNKEIITEVSSSKKLVYIGASLGVVLLALAIVLLIFFRHRSRDISTSSGKDSSMVYATPHCHRQDAHRASASPLAAEEDQGKHRDFRRGDEENNVYSNVTVSSESHTQPHGLLYTTVCFNTHTVGSAPTPDTAAITYSAIRRISTGEATVYCNV